MDAKNILPMCLGMAMLAIVLSVGLLCNSIAGFKERKKKLGEWGWEYLFDVLIALASIATAGYGIFMLSQLR